MNDDIYSQGDKLESLLSPDQRKEDPGPDQSKSQSQLELNVLTADAPVDKKRETVRFDPTEPMEMELESVYDPMDPMAADEPFGGDLRRSASRSQMSLSGQSSRESNRNSAKVEIELASFTRRSTAHSVMRKRPVNKKDGALRRQNTQDKTLPVKDKDGKKSEIKLTLTRWERYQITLYHIAEPFLVGAIVGACLQLPDLATTVYMLISFCGLGPLVLTQHVSKIKLKKILSFVILLLSNLVIILKTLAWVFANKWIVDNQNYAHAFGIYKEADDLPDDEADSTLYQVNKTFGSDLTILVLSILLLFVYNDHIEQAEARIAIINKQDYQTKIKYHHPAFGRYHMTMLAMVLTFFLCDALTVVTVVQEIVLFVLVVSMYLWIFQTALAERYIDKCVRFLQIIYFIQGAVSFVILIPGVLSFLLKILGLKEDDQNDYLIFLGIIGYENKANGSSAFRVHYVLLSSAVMMTEAYFVCLKVKANSPKQNLASGVRKDYGHTSVTDQTSQQNGDSFNVGDSGFNERSMIGARAMQSRALTIIIKPDEEKGKKDSFLDNMFEFWQMSRMLSVLWICRGLAFIHVYMYHDWQSVPMLIWLLHSTVFDNKSIFKQAIRWFYLPWFTLTLFWYYTINIISLTDFDMDPAVEEIYYPFKYNIQFNRGWYELTIPFLQIGLMLITLFFYALLVSYMDESTEPPFRLNQFMDKIADKSTSSIYQLAFLAVVYIEYPLMFVLVLAGLDKMDVFHIILLMFFVLYMLCPDCYRQSSKVFIFYANLFVLEKYLYTLITQPYLGKPGSDDFEGEDVKEIPLVKPNFDLMDILGMSDNYQPTPYYQKYFRYNPQLDQWLLVFLTFLQYRRQSIIGADANQLNETEFKCKHILFQKYRNAYKFVSAFSIGFNHILVIFSFSLYLLLLVFIQQSLINAISQAIVLSLLCIYMSKGLIVLVEYWGILIFYQAFVLMSQIMFQFLFSPPFLSVWERKIDAPDNLEYLRKVMQTIGFYRPCGETNGKNEPDVTICDQNADEEKLWQYFLPYVCLFALSVILAKRIRTKIKRESKVDGKMRAQYLHDKKQKQKKNYQRMTTNLVSFHEDQDDMESGNRQYGTETRAASKSMAPERQLTQPLIEEDEREDNESSQWQFDKDLDSQLGSSVKNFGGVDGDLAEIELQNYQDYQNMKYQVAYMVYRIQEFWGVLDFISEYFHLILSTAVLCFALYFQWSVVWAVQLTFFLAQSIMVSQVNYQYRDEQDKLFKEKHAAFMEQYKTQNTKKKSSDRPLSSMIIKKKSNMLKADRATSTNSLKDSVKKTKDDDRSASKKFGTDLQDLASPVNQSLPTVEACEDKASKRLQLTDEEALEEFEKFRMDICRVSLPTRYTFWLAQYVLIVITVTLIYINTIDIQYLYALSPEDQKSFTFLLFILGFFNREYAFEDMKAHETVFWNSSYPYYVLLFVLIFEKLAQNWIESKFGCTKEKMEIFQAVEKRQQLFKEQLEKKQGKGARTSKYFITADDREKVVRDDKTESMHTDSFVSEKERTPSIDPITGLRIIQEESEQSVYDDFHSLKTATLESSKREREHISGNSLNKSNVSSSFVSARSNNPSQAPVNDLTKQMDLLKSVDDKEVPLPSPSPTIPHKDPKFVVEEDNKITNTIAERDEILKRLKPLIEVKSLIDTFRGVKIGLEALVILIVWFSTIYKQNIFSLILFISLVLYTLKRDNNSLLVVRTTVAIVFVIEYWICVANLCSYNSPKKFPLVLLGNNNNGTDTGVVYPYVNFNPETQTYDKVQYYGIPLFMNGIHSNNMYDGQWQDQTIDLQKWSYFGMYADARRLNGMWFDYMVNILVYVYFNICNFWLLFRPVKIVASQNTKNDLLRLSQLTKDKDDDAELSKKEQIKKTKMRLRLTYPVTRAYRLASQWFYMNFHLVLIAFTLAVSILNQSLLSFGYFIFCMLLIQDNKNFLDRKLSQDRLLWLLKNFLLPYLVVDICFQLLYQMPFEIFDEKKEVGTTNWYNAVGFEKVWESEPKTIFVGYEGEVNEVTKTGLTSLMLKGLTFFMIQIQLSIMESHNYNKYKAMQGSDHENVRAKTGLGMAYRFNNFKNKKVLKQAEELDRIDQMQTHVKRLIRKRDKLYKMQDKKESKFLKNRRQSAQNSFKDQSMSSMLLASDDKVAYDKGMAPIYEEKDDFDERSFGSIGSRSESSLYEEKWKETQLKDDQEINVIYAAKMKKLNLCIKTYMWLRKTFVLDILFRSSEEHLDEIVEQLQRGRTSVKSKIEIGVMNEAKREWFEQKKSERLERQLMEKTQIDRATTVNISSFGGDRKSSFAGDKSGADEIDKVDRAVNSMVTQLVKQQHDRENEEFEERRSKAFETSSKPWESVTMKNYKSYWKMFVRYISLLVKIIMSHSEYFVYFWMMLATISNDGILYMVFPFIIFGWALMLETKPGKNFWYFVVIYTQGLIVANFIVQLQLWEVIMVHNCETPATPDDPVPCTTQLDWIIYVDKSSLGLGWPTDHQRSFYSVFMYFLPEIMILSTCLVHIQSEILAGTFDQTLQDYENFEEGLTRYRIQICDDEEEKKEIEQADRQLFAMKVELTSTEINQFKQEESWSDYDRYEHMENQGFTDRGLAPLEFVFNPQTHYPMDVASLKKKKLTASGRQLAGRSFDETSEIYVLQGSAPKAFSQDALRELNLKEEATGTFWERLVRQGFSTLFYDNWFFDELYPTIKQQKPGTDLYVFICTVEFVICIYILVFYSYMKNQTESIADQFTANQFAPGMVIALFLMIAVMVIDRIIYGMYVLLDQGEPVAEQPDGQILQEDERLTNRASHQPMKNEQPNASTFSKSEGHGPLMTQKSFENGMGNTTEISDSDFVTQFDFFLEDKSEVASDDFIDGTKKVFKESLIPQKSKKSGYRMVKFYYQWFVLILVHWYIFFWLPDNMGYCLEDFTNTYSSYKTVHQILATQDVEPDDPGTGNGGDSPTAPKSDVPTADADAVFVCNVFNQNGAIIVLYMFFCIYFGLSAAQIKYGMPEIRKGSFMMDRFDPISGYTFRGFLAIPFIFELRSIIDWTFTSTALDVFQWIKLAQIQADMYVAKVVNREYMRQKLGTPRKKIEKLGVGCSLMLLVIALLAGPILLFSSINPISVSNPILKQDGEINFSITITQKNTKIETQVPLFKTTEYIMNEEMTTSEYDELDLPSFSATTSLFDPTQIQNIQFSKHSDDIWLVSKPRKEQLVLALVEELLLGKTSLESLKQYSDITAMLNYTMSRGDSGGASQIKGGYTWDLNNSEQTQPLIKSILYQLSCQNPKVVDNIKDVQDSVFGPINMAVKTDATSNAEVFTTQATFLNYTVDDLGQAVPGETQQLFDEFFTLFYKCTPITVEPTADANDDNGKNKNKDKKNDRGFIGNLIFRPVDEAKRLLKAGLIDTNDLIDYTLFNTGQAYWSLVKAPLNVDFQRGSQLYNFTQNYTDEDPPKILNKDPDYKSRSCDCVVANVELDEYGVRASKSSAGDPDCNYSLGVKLPSSGQTNNEKPNPPNGDFTVAKECAIFIPDQGVALTVFAQKVLPSFLRDYSSNLIVFYISVVFVIATLFRGAFVPKTNEIFIKDAPYTEDLLMICQSIHIYRVQRQLLKEEELYFILIDIMRSPEMIKSVCGSSLKKKLQ